jgi:hypothetical protein
VFCGGIGDVFAVRRGAAVPACLKSPPTGYNLLVCPNRLLKKFFDLEERHNCYRQKGRKDLEWVVRGIPYGCVGTCWGRRLQYISRMTVVSRRRRPEVSEVSETLSLDSDGALCFGVFQGKLKG